jgi:hypothetical protein
VFGASHARPAAIQTTQTHSYTHREYPALRKSATRPLTSATPQYTTGLPLDDLHKEIHVSTHYLASRLPLNLPHSTHSSSTTTTAPGSLPSLSAFHHELLGVLTHEAVHCYQHNGQGTAPGGLIEGIADFVRLKAGLAPPHWKKGTSEESRGRKWDEGYQKTAWFLEWLEGRCGNGVVGRINESLGRGRYVEGQFWEGVCGCTVQSLWEEYKESWDKDESEHTGDRDGKKGEDKERAAAGEDDGEKEQTGAEETEPEMVDLSPEEKEEAAADGRRVESKIKARNRVESTR